MARWRIVPCRPPHIVRRCPRCDVQRSFVCTDAFRVNANGRRVDAWLLYRCMHCAETWKAPVLERAAVSEVDPIRLAALTRNDSELARRIALDTRWLATLNVPVDRDVPVRVDRDVVAPPADGILLEVPFAVSLRLDRLLSRELGLPRSVLRDRIARGEIDILPGGDRALRRPPRDGVVIAVHGADSATGSIR